MEKLRLVLIFLLLIIVACAGAMASINERSPTLRLINNSGDQVRVYVDGRLLGTAIRHDECFYLRFLSQGANTISFRSIAQGTQVAPAANLRSQPGWVVELNRNWTFDVQSLRPAERCNK